MEAYYLLSFYCWARLQSSVLSLRSPFLEGSSAREGPDLGKSTASFEASVGRGCRNPDILAALVSRMDQPERS